MIKLHPEATIFFLLWDLPTRFLTVRVLGSFRGLFYKGDGNTCTPSVWLHPNSNRLALRVTTSTKPHIGMDSRTQLAAGKWTHVAFSFSNTTVGEFFAAIYVNGLLDVSGTFRDVVNLGPDFPLYIGRDPSTPGPRYSNSARLPVMNLELSRIETLTSQATMGIRYFG